MERRSRLLFIPDGWWPEYADGIDKLLWEDLGNWRSALRKRARVFVTQRYQWDPENRHDANQQIACSCWNGQQGKTNNLAHPALAGLVVDFFYNGDKTVGKLFPEVFREQVPRVAVAIAATALKVVLDEFASSQGEVNFKVATYSPVYLEMLGLMKKCDTVPVHAMKTKALRCKWAQIGSGGGTVPNILTASSSGLDVTLD
ncbi:hypothetical protein HD554DRAFT_2170836 [Boletus coccyginus]|nr:hypothetical protein HD554DRAFT_2170836 [Boletus coccyginus]